MSSQESKDLKKKPHMVHFVYLFYDLPVWGAVETSAAQHWDNDKNKNSKAIKLAL